MSTQKTETVQRRKVPRRAIPTFVARCRRWEHAVRFDLARWCEGCGKFKSIVGFGVSQRLRGQSQPLLSERSEIARPVHILGGLPTEPVNSGFDRIREVLRVYSLAEFIGGPLDEWTETGVLLPPSIETSEIVENWEACDFLAARFGRGAFAGTPEFSSWALLRSSR